MTYESLRNIFVYSGIASLVLAGIAIVLFFLLDIPDAYAYLSGRTRKRGIEQIRDEASGQQENTKKKKKEKRTAAVRRERKNTPVKAKEQTETAITERLPARPVEMAQQGAEQTTLLAQNRTGLQDNGGNQTTLLANTAVALQTRVEMQPFVVEHEITILHSDVLI